MTSAPTSAPTIAYLANQFPSPVEPYVVEEIEELRKRGVQVIPSSARQPVPGLDRGLRSFAVQTMYIQPFNPFLLMGAAWLCIRKVHLLSDLLARVLFRGNESLAQRIRALAHTWLGACYALQLRDRGVQHIHVHHGYFSSWIALVAAKLSAIPYSMTLHGSDLLLHAAYLDVKLANCRFCLTISEFNRSHILRQYPGVDPGRILLRRMGAATREQPLSTSDMAGDSRQLIILAVGRLHPVKDHAFLVRACRKLKDDQTPFQCWIAGDGPGRAVLKQLIRDLDLEDEISLLGHLGRTQLDSFYEACDLVALTSRSEGIPLVLMEAMAHGKLVLAPSITGIPELVIHGKTGFLYRPGALDDFVLQAQTIRRQMAALAPIRRAAQRHVVEHFNRGQNLARFGDLFLGQLAKEPRNYHANSLLQQI